MDNVLNCETLCNAHDGVHDFKWIYVWHIISFVSHGGNANITNSAMMHNDASDPPNLRFISSFLLWRRLFVAFLKKRKQKKHIAGVSKRFHGWFHKQHTSNSNDEFFSFNASQTINQHVSKKILLHLVCEKRRGELWQGISWLLHHHNPTVHNALSIWHFLRTKNIAAL